MLPIVDLHSDLLSYLAVDFARSPLDGASRSALPQLKQGNVRLQTLAIFTETTANSTQLARRQLDAFHRLRRSFDCTFTQFMLAFENGSGFAEESEPLGKALQRIEAILAEIQYLAYIGMTWNGENRFGGGTGSTAGLKSDGKTLLQWMSSRGIAIDFSHTSDALAEGILNYIDQQGLKIPVLASHSNFRIVTPQDRNLPNWLAQELIARQGLIGINLFAPFIHDKDSAMLGRHVEQALRLQGEQALVFGADFFCDIDFPDLLEKYRSPLPFFEAYGNASCYPDVLSFLKKKLGLSDSALSQIAHLNAFHFFKRLGIPLEPLA